MNYTNLFNTLHSEVISEDVKEDIVSKVLDKVVLTNEDLLAESINESNDKVVPYVEALSLLVNSDITNEALEEAIDEIFANETQEVIDSVTEAFQEDVVRGILIEQLLEEEGLSEGSPAPVGLAGLRRAAGEEPIQRKTEPQPKTQQPKQPTQQKSEKTGHLYVKKVSDGTYRGARTKEMKDTVLKARKEAQGRAERRSARVKVNKAIQASTIGQTGSKEAIPMGQKKEANNLEGTVGKAKEERSKKIKNSKLEATGIAPTSKKRATSNSNSESDAAISNARKNVGTDPFKNTPADKPETDEEKIARLEGNSSAQKAVRNKKKKEAEGQLHLDLNGNGNDNNEPTKPKRRGRPAGSKNKPKAADTKKEEVAEVKPKKDETKKTSTVYLKGGEEPSTKKQPENFESSNLDQEIYTARKDALDLPKGSPERAEAMKKWKELKAKKEAALKESLTSSLVTLLSSNISESSIRDICKKIAKKKEM